MATHNELAGIYEALLREAVSEDRRTKAASAVLEDRAAVRKTRLASALAEVGRRIDSLNYGDESQPASEPDKQEVVDRLAERLGLPDPRRLRRVLREASVQNFLAVLVDIQTILQRIK